MHAQTNRWGGPEALLVEEAQPAKPVSRALAPARGALFGVLLGILCWSAIAAAVWVAL